MTGTKVALGAAAGIGMIDITQIVQLKEMGMVAMLLVALIALYKDGKKQTNELKSVIEKNTEQRATETEVLRQLQQEIARCHENRIRRGDHE